MGPIKKLAAEGRKEWARLKADECRRGGATSGMIDHSLSIVCELATAVGDEDPSEQYIKAGAASRLESRLPGLDPATILLLVQLIWLVYQALKAIGVLSREGLASLSPASIIEHLGGL